MSKETNNIPVIKEQTKLSIAFQELAPQVKKEDVARAVIDLHTSDTTIWRYLKGDVAKEGFGLDLFTCLRNSIIMREQNLNRAVA